MFPPPPVGFGAIDVRREKAVRGDPVPNPSGSEVPRAPCLSGQRLLLTQVQVREVHGVKQSLVTGAALRHGPNTRCERSPKPVRRLGRVVAGAWRIGLP